MFHPYFYLPRKLIGDDHRFLYLCQTGFAIWAMIPNKELDMYDSDNEDDDYRKPAARDKGVTVQMQPTPPNEQLPFTPRTQAFHTLERKLPLRNN